MSAWREAEVGQSGVEGSGGGSGAEEVVRGRGAEGVGGAERRGLRGRGGAPSTRFTLIMGRVSTWESDTHRDS